MGLEGRRVLFISYNGMLEPLGQTQVIAYLRELAKRGIKFTLLSFEKAEAFTAEGRKCSNNLKRELATQNIEWHWLRYHRTPSLPATLFDVYAGIRYASRLVRENKIEMVHARGHIPGSINIPVDELRDRLAELPAGPLVLHCQVGQRGHTAARLLAQHGFDVVNLDGGYPTWAAGSAATRFQQGPHSEAATSAMP